MKKSKLLSLLTATAIVITTGATYAVWDSVTDDTTATVTFRNPVTVTVSPSYTLSQDPAALNVTPTASGTVNFTVSNGDNLADTLTIVPTVSGGTSATVEDFNFEIVDTGESGTPNLTGAATSGFVDTSLTTTNYTVKVTPKDESVTKVAGQAVSGLMSIFGTQKIKLFYATFLAINSH